MQNNKTVAVLMSTYNGENFLQTQIDSILAQQCELSIDLYVRDDGSTDSTISILEEYAQKGQLKLYKGKNIGPAKSFLELISLCPDYDYYSLADQDDFWMDNKIQRAVDFLSEKRTDCIYFSNAYIASEELLTGKSLVYKFKPSLDLKTLSCYGGILGCTMVFNAKIISKIKSVDLPERMIMHDFYLAETCLALGGQIIFDDVPMMKYRQHCNNAIGVPTNIYNKVKNRIGIIFHIYKTSIAVQANEIIKLYGNVISMENLVWLCKVSNYRNCFLNRLLLAFTPKTKYPRFNLGLTTRLSILLGNR